MDLLMQVQKKGMSMLLKMTVILLCSLQVIMAPLFTL